jgi:hypothetical protein
MVLNMLDQVFWFKVSGRSHLAVALWSRTSFVVGSALAREVAVVLATDSSTGHGWFASKTISHVISVLCALLAFRLDIFPKHVAITDPDVDCIAIIFLIINVVLRHLLLIVRAIKLIVPVFCRRSTFLFFSGVFENASHVLLEVFHLKFVDHVPTLSYAFHGQLINRLMCILDILALEVACALTIRVELVLRLVTSVVLLQLLNVVAVKVSKNLVKLRLHFTDLTVHLLLVLLFLLRINLLVFR